MFHCLQIYIFVTDNRQFQYFTFLPHDVEILVKFTFLPLVVTLIVHLHFRRYTCCCSCIVCKSTFLPVVCIAYKFRFLPLAVTLHFAACSCIAYVFFLFCKFAFLPLAGALFEHLHFVAHYCIVLEQTIDYITEATRQ